MADLDLCSLGRSVAASDGSKVLRRFGHAAASLAVMDVDLDQLPSLEDVEDTSRSSSALAAVSVSLTWEPKLAADDVRRWVDRQRRLSEVVPAVAVAAVVEGDAPDDGLDELVVAALRRLDMEVDRDRSIVLALETRAGVVSVRTGAGRRIVAASLRRDLQGSRLQFPHRSSAPFEGECHLGGSLATWPVRSSAARASKFPVEFALLLAFACLPLLSQAASFAWTPPGLAIELAERA